MIRAAAFAAALLASAGGLRGDAAGAFDYYVLALSWSPGWCAAEGVATAAAQCAPGRDFGWILHGLWPQHETGYPEYCATALPDPSRAQSDAMADIMGSGGLAWHQWKKHGRCSGLSGPDYYRLARAAWARVTRPAILRQIDDPVRLPAKVVEEAFLEANPGWTADMVTITCRDGRIAEARLCLTRALAPRRCGADVRRDCARDDALLVPIR